MSIADLELWKSADQRRKSGVEQSAETSGESWKDYAVEFVRRYLRTHAELFVDDLWTAGLIEPRSPRALGAVIQEAVKRGWIKEQALANGVLAKPSVRSNLQLKRVWRSLLFSS